MRRAQSGTHGSCSVMIWSQDPRVIAQDALDDELFA
jgi:hypothetical protein